MANVYTSLSNAIWYTDKCSISTGNTAVTYQVYATALGSSPAEGNIYSGPPEIGANEAKQIYVGVGNYITVTGSNYTAQEIGGQTSAQAGVGNFTEQFIAPPTTGLILSLDAGNPASYPGSGTTWTDTTGGKTFALSGGPTYSSDNGGYLSFNGSSQYAYASTPLATLGTWTLESWYFYNSTASGQNSQIITDALGSAINYRLGYQASGTFVSAGYFAGAWRETTPYTLTNNTWNQIVGTYDGTNLKVYVNGALVQTNTGGLTLASGGAGILLMTEWTVGDPQGYLGGRLAIVNIYNQDIGLANIQSNYNANLSRFAAPVVTSGSMFIPGTSSRVTLTPGIAAGSTSTTPFTVEGWFYSTVTPGTNSGPVLLSTNTSSATPAYSKALTVNIGSATQIVVDSNGAAALTFSFAETMLINTWYYVAVTRDSSGFIQVWMGKDGDANATASTTGRVSVSGNVNWNLAGLSNSIGAFVPASRFTTGYISNLRVDSASLYATTAATIPVPTEPFAELAGTVFLQNDATLTDQTGTQTLTAVGTAAGNVLNPF
jgi:hypothetical protein